MALSILIVVPTLDSFSILSRLVSSLQKQTWQDWRLLFVDGNSSQEHRDWLEDCCSRDSRFFWELQDSSQIGIFGAMNQGFARASPDDWVVFWGSDDWAAGPNVLADAVDAIASSSAIDLLVCRGRYANVSSGSLTRSAVFHADGYLTARSYRRCLFQGSTPPHQSTFIGPRIRSSFFCYAPGFRLSADLDYFLRLSRFPDLCVRCVNIELVHMSDSGISGQQPQRRLQEVRWAYRRAFGWLWLFPFLTRYLRRIAIVFKTV